MTVLPTFLLASSFLAGGGDDTTAVHVDLGAAKALQGAAFTDDAVLTTGGPGWVEFVVDVPLHGRYDSRIAVKAQGDAPSTLWLEDRIGNPDGRCYDVTGPIAFAGGADTVGRSGSPLDAGEHRMRLHFDGGALRIDDLEFELRVAHEATPTTHVQRTEGDAWTLVWSDEFEGEGLPNPANWAYDVGDWGWGNREPQEYTAEDTRNARVENGQLVIEARKDAHGHWTSARLTTRGRRSFLYGRIEFRAKAPAGDGAWAAGWLLGDAYRDEISWPYCGEIDVLEAVGREIDDTTGDGLNHGSCHTRAYYFKQGNHISNTLPVEGMADGFHDYVCEWTPTSVKMFVDGTHYYTYDKTANALEWPFAEPQNLILNLAMGGGMGGPIDPALISQELRVEYVRVFGKH